MSNNPPPPQGPTDIPPFLQGLGNLLPFLIPYGISFEPPHYENLSRLINSITILLNLAYQAGPCGEKKAGQEDKELRELIFMVTSTVMEGMEEYYENLKERTVKPPFKLYSIDGTKGKTSPPEGSPTKPVA